ncbi:MAG: hypothetical protein ACRC8J_04050 [Phocaeicola sp.]
MKTIKKSTWMPLALLVYTTVIAFFFLPKNHEISDTEKFVTLGASYLIIGVLYWALRSQEKRREKDKKE